MSATFSKQKTPIAWVVFSGEADIAWLKILKPGFRHCAVLLNDGERWITVDPLSSYTDICVHALPLDFNLPQWMRDSGYIVTQAPVYRGCKPAPWTVLSCVESVKRILGIRKRMIFTPWQLYRHLTSLETSQYSKGDLAWEV